MYIKKSLLLISLCLTIVSNIDAGWSSWIKNFFGSYFGSYYRKTLLNKKQVFIGTIGALAIAGIIAGSTWWYRQCPSKDSKVKNPEVLKPEVSQEELSKIQEKIATLDTAITTEESTIAQITSGFKQQKQEDANLKEMFQSIKQTWQDIIQLKEKNTFKVYDVVKIVLGPSYRFSEAIGHLGIVIEIFDQEKLLTVDIISDGLNKRPTSRLTLVRQLQDFFEKVEIEQGQNKKISLYQEIVIKMKTNQENMMPCIGRVIKKDDNKITVIAGSKSANIPLQNIICKAEDIFVNKEVGIIQVTELF